MSRLAPRRFPDTVTRRRQLEGSRNSAGEFVPGAVQETDMSASVQPLALEDSDIAGGVSAVERIKVFVPDDYGLLAAFGGAEADRVVWQGQEFVVERSTSWAGSHCRADCLRET